MTDRCPSTLHDFLIGDYRCKRDAGHAGEHVNGVWTWLDSTSFAPATAADPCGATIRVQPQRWAAHACTRPSGHDGAHGDGLLLWCDPSPIPQAASNNTDYFWED